MGFKLNRLIKFQGRKGPLLLIIMDGVGIGREYPGNAVYMAKKPALDKLFKGPLYTTLQAHGKAVGLPSDDDMGNSEVGHNALGAGRVFAQGAKRVNLAIGDGSIFKNETWKRLVSGCCSNGHILHFIGLLSDGNVHSHIEQLFAMLHKASDENVAHVRCMSFLTGGMCLKNQPWHT